MSYSLLAAVRFDPFLETFTWNNGPDDLPSPYLLLSHQFHRFVSASVAAQWPSAHLTFDKLKSVCDNVVRKANGTCMRRPLKIRLILSPSGDLTASAAPIPPLRYDPTLPSLFTPDAVSPVPFEPIWRIHIDTQPTSDTMSMKTTNRRPYDDARARAGMPPLGVPSHDVDAPACPDDVILYNASGAVTETSICNIAFYRRGRWITPPLSVGCISGIVRRWLLENNRIHEADDHELSLSTICDNDWALVFNGVIGCRLGKVRIRG
ncbi:aminotransferase [Pisolithus croceorrhizus]|nr:aminotransferase [Pisolithus croceorrhizus]KAI6135517.1 aminotransferase [Pisolithus croceorrhizus]